MIHIGLLIVTGIFYYLRKMKIIDAGSADLQRGVKGNPSWHYFGFKRIGPGLATRATPETHART